MFKLINYKKNLLIALMSGIMMSFMAGAAMADGETETAEQKR